MEVKRSLKLWVDNVYFNMIGPMLKGQDSRISQVVSQTAMVDDVYSWRGQTDKGK